MLLTITTTQKPATDLGYLLAKHPDKAQSFDLAYGQAHVFYPRADEDECTACLLPDIDPIGLVRGRDRSKSRREGTLAEYVNDRPYVSSSFLSVAIAQVLGSALRGSSKDRPELAATSIPLRAELSVVPCRGGESLLRRLFEPLGYRVDASRVPLDENFPDWGEGPYFRVALSSKKTVSELLTHLYVLLPVLDNQKHYWVGRDEKTAESRFGIPNDGFGKIYTRTGRPFFPDGELEARFLERIRSALSAANLWKE